MINLIKSGTEIEKNDYSITMFIHSLQEVVVNPKQCNFGSKQPPVCKLKHFAQGPVP